MEGKLYTKEEASRMKDALTIAMKESPFIENVKEAKDKNGTFRVVVSTEELNRNGATVVQKGVDWKDWLNNPVILWNHGTWDGQDLPVAVGTKITLDESEKIPRIIAEGVFAGHEHAQNIRMLHDMGLTAVSMGYYVNDYGENEKGETDYSVFSKSTMVEFSLVSIPANPNAIRAKNKALNVEEMITNGLIIPTNETDPIPARGDSAEEKEEEEKENVENSVDEPTNKDILQAIQDVSAQLGVIGKVGDNHGDNTDEINEGADFAKQNSIRKMKRCSTLLNEALRDLKIK